MTDADRIYASGPDPPAGSFEFDAAVAAAFDDMIRRSVPGYELILGMLPTFVRRYGGDGGLWDLGCSTGAVARLMRTHAPESNAIVAIDSSPAMIEAARKRPSDGIEYRVGDIADADVRDASFVALNLTLQFIPVSRRDSVIANLASGLRSGGGLLLTEKVQTDDATRRLHEAFKRAHGYSDSEIARKRTAIENRLIPEPLETHLRRLHRVGFTETTVWWQCLGFASIIATRE